MPTYELEHSGIAIIVLGSFNPAILSPDWFFRHRIIGEEDLAEATKKDGNMLVTPEVAQWDTGTFGLRVQSNRLEIFTIGAISPAIADVSGAALALLPHTPVEAFGINVMSHYRLQSRQQYHQIGDRLAPKELWRQVFPGDDRAIGLESLTLIIEPNARDAEKRSRHTKRVTVQPSRRVPNGVFMSFNDHVDLLELEADATLRARTTAEQIPRRWEATYVEAMNSFEATLALVTQEAN